MTSKSESLRQSLGLPGTARAALLRFTFAARPEETVRWRRRADRTPPARGKPRAGGPVQA
eukprot:7871889-Pyramimonas_sp.AAC.1